MGDWNETIQAMNAEAQDRPMTTETELLQYRVPHLETAMRGAIELLKENTQGSPARSAGHNARLVLEAALRRPPPSGAEQGEAAIEVKPLEWIIPMGSETLSRAETVIGNYRVWTHHEANGQWFWGTDFHGGGSGQASGPDTCKDAAQADYEARIRSALYLRPAQSQEGVEGLVAATKHLMDCASAVIGAHTEDGDAQEAFDMLFAAKAQCRKALAGLEPK